MVAHIKGDMERAADLQKESLALYRQADGAGTRRETGICFEACGTLAAAQGQAQRAARLLGAASALREAIGVPLPPVDRPEM